MASRPLWRGTITFSLVSVPVTMYGASRPSQIDLVALLERSLGRPRGKAPANGRDRASRADAKDAAASMPAAKPASSPTSRRAPARRSRRRQA